MFKKFKQSKRTYIIITIMGVSLVIIAFLGTRQFSLDGGGPGSGPSVLIHNFSFHESGGSSYFQVDVAISDSKDQIKSYYVSLLLNGERYSLYDANTAGGPYGLSVTRTIQYYLVNLGKSITASDSTVLKLAATDIHDNYASTTLTVSFTYENPEQESSESGIWSPSLPTTFDIFIPAIFTLISLIYIRKRWRN